MRNNSLLHLIFLLFFIEPASVSAQWSKVLATPNAGAYCFREYKGQLYMGGPFQYQIKMPGMNFSNLARVGRWNGTSWDSLGTGIPNGAVRAMTVYSNELVMAGSFSLAAGVPCNNIVKWDGTTFSALGTGIPNAMTVRDLCVYNSELYAAGNFTNAGGTPIAHIAKWDGFTWSSVGSGLNGQAYSLADYKSELYVSGSFTLAGNVPVNYIARWNGSKWDSVAGGVGGLVQTMRVFNNELYCGGNFYSAGSVPVTHIAKWNGTSWNAVNNGTTTSGYVNDLEVYANRLIVAGKFSGAGAVTATNVIAWTGTQWEPLGAGNELYPSTDPYVAYPYNGDLFVSGLLTHIAGDTSFYLASYRSPDIVTRISHASGDEAKFSVYPSPARDRVYVRTNLEGILNVYDAAGSSVILNRIIDQDVGELKFDGMKRGLYLVELISGPERMRCKIVITGD